MIGKRTIGVGYITCPYDANLSKFKEICYKTRTVSMLTDESEVYHRVKIGQNLLSQIVFPDFGKGELIGSIVVYIRIRTSSIPIIISVLELADEGSDLLSGQWRLDTHTNSGNVALVQGDVERGTIDIVAHSIEEGPAEVNIRATSKDKKSVVSVESDGEVKVMGTTLVKLKSDEEINVEAKKVTLGEESFEPLVLGDKFQSFMEDVLSTLKSLVVTTPSGPGTVDPATQILLTKYSQQLKTLLSSVVKTQ